jgi:hypothetical protein
MGIISGYRAMAISTDTGNVAGLLGYGKCGDYPPPYRNVGKNLPNT